MELFCGSMNMNIMFFVSSVKLKIMINMMKEKWVMGWCGCFSNCWVLECCISGIIFLDDYVFFFSVLFLVCFGIIVRIRFEDSRKNFIFVGDR